MLYVAGDRFFRRDLDAIRRVFPPSCQIYTGLGATECTTLHHHWIVPRDAVATTDLVPVGFDVPDKHTRNVPGICDVAVLAREAACILKEEGIRPCDLIACDLGPASPQINTTLPYRLRKAWRSLRRGERHFTFAWATGAFLNFVLPVRWLKAYTRRAATRAPTPAQAPYTAMNRLVFRSLGRWTPRRYEGTLTLIKPVNGLGKATPEPPPDFGWGPYTAGVLIQPVEGGHVDMFAPVARASLAACMMQK